MEKCLRYFKCKKCESLSVGPDTEGVELTCGAFTNFELMDAQDAMDHGATPDWDKALKLGRVRFASVSSCGGELQEISEEESNDAASKMTDEIEFIGVREII
jgi:hypothetical protein